MTKQEEIREEMAVRLHQQSNDGFSYHTVRDRYLADADVLLGYLHSQGVVIKVDRKIEQDLWMPEGSACVGANGAWLNKTAVKAIMDLATEPLVEE